MRRRTAVALAATVLIAATPAGIAGAAGPALKHGSGVVCEHASGTTKSAVELSSCHAGGEMVGTGSVPGSTFKDTKTGTVAWRDGNHSYSTTITVKTSLGPNPGTGWCPRKGLGHQYYVSGKVTANTEPHIAVGDSVYASICISAAGVVKQSHYGRFSF
jgi:hypothetical protein